MFKDYIQIRLKAGNGGDGIVSFRREKYIPDGGPDGGDGGKGGDIIFKATTDMNTLASYDYNKLYKAEDGGNGAGAKMKGKSGEDLYLNVPVGTVIYIDSKPVADLYKENMEVKLLKGGRGGFGNTRFKTSTKQAPNFAIKGDKTKEVTVVLELKMLADVGLVGFPNAGKSTFLASVTNAKPKIANYPFTTLSPNLGVVKGYGDTFLIADIPGIIEGASEGVGLGHKFLKHIERTRLLLIFVDISGFTYTAKYQIENLEKELNKYSEKLKAKERIVVGTKADIKNEDEEKYLKEYADKNGLKYFEISSVQTKGLKELLGYISKRLTEIPKDKMEVEELEKVYVLEDEEDGFEIDVQNVEEIKKGILKGSYVDADLKYKVFKVTGPAIERLMQRINIGDYESLNYMQLMLDRMGVVKELRKKGVQNGDTIDILGYQFEWFED